MLQKYPFIFSNIYIYFLITKIFEKSIPHVEHPDPEFLAQAERNLIDLINTQGTPVCLEARQHIVVIFYFQVVQSCVQCLCEIVTKVTKNYARPEELMRKYYPFLESCRNQIQNPDKKAFAPLVRSVSICVLVINCI